MNWMPASVLTTLVVLCGPLLTGEVTVRARRSDGVSTIPRVQRRQRVLRIATLAAAAAFATWFIVDHAAIAGGHRRFVIAAANLAAGVALFAAFSWPLLSAVRACPAPIDPPTRSHRRTAAARLRDVLACEQVLLVELFMSAAFVMVIAALVLSGNDAGYRAKGALLLVAGPGLVLMEIDRLVLSTDGLQPRQLVTRALPYFAAVECAAFLTLTLDWSVPLQRWLGVGAQLVVGLLGFVVCARYLAAEVQA